MIKLDIATASNTIIATLKEKTIGTNPKYKLELYNFYTGETFLYSNLTSVANERKDIITLTFSNEFIGRIPAVGQYKYKFSEFIGSTASYTYSVVEVGMAKVINTSVVEEDVFIEPTETSDDYIVL